MKRIFCTVSHISNGFREYLQIYFDNTNKNEKKRKKESGNNRKTTRIEPEESYVSLG